MTIVLYSNKRRVKLAGLFEDCSVKVWDASLEGHPKNRRVICRNAVGLLDFEGQGCVIITKDHKILFSSARGQCEIIPMIGEDRDTPTDIVVMLGYIIVYCQISVHCYRISANKLIEIGHVIPIVEFSILRFADILGLRDENDRMEIISTINTIVSNHQSRSFSFDYEKSDHNTSIKIRRFLLLVPEVKNQYPEFYDMINKADDIAIGIHTWFLLTKDGKVMRLRTSNILNIFNVKELKLPRYDRIYPNSIDKIERLFINSHPSKIIMITEDNNCWSYQEHFKFFEHRYNVKYDSYIFFDKKVRFIGNNIQNVFSINPHICIIVTNTNKIFQVSITGNHVERIRIRLSSDDRIQDIRHIIVDEVFVIRNITFAITSKGKIFILNIRNNKSHFNKITYFSKKKINTSN